VDLRKSGGVATRRKQNDQPEALRTYRTKRDPARTPEPMGGRRAARTRNTSRFVIQEHHARALHWDLRLERDGVLASWALPKGLPDAPKRNHLAVHTEDHPIEYATFSGDIPAGEYGAGTMAIWDSGTYETEKWSDTEVKFVLHGSRASGDFVLFQTDGKNWMIHRHGDSVLTDPIPTSIKPMLAVLGTLPEGRTTWAYEVKWDGARTLAFVDGGRVRLQSRSERDVTPMFPELAGMGEHLGMRAVVLDGEVVAFGDDGRPSFARLQNRLHLADPKEARRRAAADPVHYVAFDVLYADGRSLMADPYDARRARLEQFEFSGDNFTTTECFRDVAGRDVLRATTENGLEGVVAKRRTSTYRPGRRVAEWVKVKVVNTQEVVIGGWTDGKGGRGASLGSLLLGIPGADGLDYVGKVGTGFDERALQSIMEQLRTLRSRTNPFTGTISDAEAKGAHFVRPSLVGEVGYGEWTPAGRLRHPTWRGLRPDKTPADVGRESEPSVSAPDDDLAPMRTRTTGTGVKNGSQRVRVGDRELSVTNLDKVLFPETGFTKGQLIDYYARVAPAMLPHLSGRPLTMKRFPDGVEGKFFFEKHAPSHTPRWVKTLRVPSERQGEIAYAAVQDLPTLIWAANLGTIEFHVPLWRAVGRRKLPTSPDQMVFDLDPGEGTSIVECCAVAELIVEALAHTHPVVLAKTSGQKGLQLYCSVPARSGWDDVRDEAHDVARQLESEHRDLVVSVMRKELRRGRVLIDWSQNHPAKTTVCVYSVRAMPQPTVSTPVTLDEVGRCARTGDPDLLRFDTEQVLARVARDGDLFAPLGQVAKP
jgi:bifunctional non-homologous end joining protein LigD